MSAKINSLLLKRLPESGMVRAVKSNPDVLHLKEELYHCMKNNLIFKRLTVLITIFWLSLPGHAQDSLSASYTDLGSISFAKNISKNISSAIISKNEHTETGYSKFVFKPGVPYKSNVPNESVTKKVVLKFNLTNSADTSIAVYFFPGFYYTGIDLFLVDTNGIKKIPAELPSVPDSIGFRKITVASHDSVTILAELTFLKTYINTTRPRLVLPSYLPAFIAEIRSNFEDTNITTYLFCGLMLMMILFSLANFVQGANPEFLFYSGYALLLGGMLFTKSLYNLTINPVSFFLEAYLDFVMQGLGIMFYMIFMQRFISTRSNFPFLHKVYNAGIVLILLSLIGYSFFHYFTDNYVLENLIENITKLLLLVLTIIFLVYSLRHWKDKLLRFLFWGNLCLFIFAVISQVAIMFDRFFQDLPGVFSSSIFYYEAGLVLELIFFLAGLNYKNRRMIIDQTKERETLKAQNMMQEYEKEIAVYKAQQEERQRISEDMHDELGAGMTAIRLMSEIARNKMKENTPVEIEKISHSANDVLNKMNAIIWSMNSGNDTLDNLISYIRSYSQEYFDGTQVECKVNTPETISSIEIAGDKRRNIFLCVKETLNNVLKHSGATEVTIDIITEPMLIIRISDNGKGIDLQNIRQFGNGLKNITRRMETIGGTFKIENREGTVTTIELPL